MMKLPFKFSTVPLNQKRWHNKLSRKGRKSISGLVTLIDCWLTKKTNFFLNFIWKYSVFCKTLETDKK